MFKKKDHGFITDSKIYINGKVDRAYNVWNNMIQRCYNKNNKGYKNYGNRGIVICDEWHLYSNFKKWYYENYVDGCEIDKDMKGDGLIYSPENCIFVTRYENTKEMLSRRDNGYMQNRKGANHPNSKPKKYYETTPTQRSQFKTTCKRNGWNFEDFEEIYSGIKNKNYIKKYYYKKK